MARELLPWCGESRGVVSRGCGESRVCGVVGVGGAVRVGGAVGAGAIGAYAR